jgi:UDP-N-acetylmuramyl pentapeptide phosphotransferase/UDP-N-acetylglucosamine-1-phosphate transferase
MTSIYYIFIAIICVVILKICETEKVFVDYKIEKHKRFVSRSDNYSIGGLIFYIFFCLLFLSESYFDFNFFISISIVFLIGLLSDIKILKNAVLRFFLQLLILVYFVFFTDLQIPLSHIEIIDILLRNYFFNKVFTIFCLLILINGNNFIDGINTLLLLNNLIISLFLAYFFLDKIYQPEIIFNYIAIIFILLCFNIKGKVILGDSGSYSLGFFMAIFLIEFDKNNSYLSPFFVISLIWYPCFELLFSIIRRLIRRKKTYKPDTHHLHQIMYSVLNENINNVKLSHFLVSIIINGYCFLSLGINYIYGYETTVIIIFLLINIIVYLIAYKKLSKRVYKDLR